MPPVREYQGVVAAAMKGENALWEIGDELIKILGRAMSTAHGQNDGSREKLREIAAELKDNGIDQYDPQTLARFRTTAIIFKESDRIKGISFSCHYEAGTPDVLREVIDHAKACGQRPSVLFIRGFKKVLAEEERDARKEARKEALEAKKEAEQEAAEAKEDKRRANDPDSREDAARREQEARERAKEAAVLAEQLKSAPPVNRLAPKKSPADTSILVVRTSFAADVQRAKDLAAKLSKSIEPHLGDLSDSFVANAVEELLEVANAFRQLASKIGNARADRRRSHLHAVGE